MDTPNLFFELYIDEEFVDVFHHEEIPEKIEELVNIGVLDSIKTNERIRLHLVVE